MYIVYINLLLKYYYGIIFELAFMLSFYFCLGLWFVSFQCRYFYIALFLFQFYFLQINLNLF